MELLTVSTAKARFSYLSRRVLKTRQPAIIRTPAGLVQLAPFEMPEYVPPSNESAKLTKEELRLQNTFGEAL